VVINSSGVHTVIYRFCGCDASDHAGNLEQLLRNSWYLATTVDPATCATFAVLDLFRLLSVVGNVNVHDFVGTLERETDACGVSKVPVSEKRRVDSRHESDMRVQDRYKAFGRMARQWAFLLRLKRAGRGHAPDGVHSTKPGECAVMCWTCPHDRINIPTGWRDVSAEFR
jgi:hypothetical protein